PAGIPPQAETAPDFDDDADANSNADDPAVWVDGAHPERSLVVGTLKNGGLTVFDLGGATAQDIPTPGEPRPDSPSGRFNNVDVLQGVQVGGLKGDIAVTTDRGRDQLRTYAIAPGGGAAPLTDVTTADP